LGPIECAQLPALHVSIVHANPSSQELAHWDDAASTPESLGFPWVSSLDEQPTTVAIPIASQAITAAGPKAVAFIGRPNCCILCCSTLKPLRHCIPYPSACRQ